jgi:hypothetical protein
MSTLTTLCFVATAAAFGVAWRMHSLNAISASRKSENKLRDEKQPEPAASSDDDNLLYHFRPIGVCRSIFAEKWGTPRQGSLAPNTRGHFKLYPTVAHTALEGIEQFSHVWVIFVFSENTNSEKEQKFVHGNKKFTFPAKIKPPLLMGRSTGIFSTR